MKPFTKISSNEYTYKNKGVTYTVKCTEIQVPIKTIWWSASFMNEEGFVHHYFGKTFPSLRKAINHCLANPDLPESQWVKWEKKGYNNQRLNKPIPHFPSEIHNLAYLSGLREAISQL